MGASAVLIVEDDAAVVNVVRRLCTSVNVPLLHAGTADEAIGVIHGSDRVHLALIDVSLGADSKGGLRVLDVLTTRRPRVVSALLTGTVNHTVAWHAGARNALFLLKPCEPEPLRGLVEAPLRAPTLAMMDTFIERQCEMWELRGQQAKIVRLTAKNYAPKDIMRELDITASTLSTYVRRLAERTKFRSLNELRAALLEAVMADVYL